MPQYVPANINLPRSLDVQISISSPQTETRTDLSLLCGVFTYLGIDPADNKTFSLPPDENRIRFYREMAEVSTDYVEGSEP